MSRRRLTIKRIDPWSVLKVGAVVNLCIWLIVLVGFGVLWFFVSQLGLVDRACDIANTTGALEDCSISGTGIFRNLVVLGFIGAVIQTGLFVVAAFLYNIISQLVGGLQFITEDGASSAVVAPATSVSDSSSKGQLREKLSSAADRAREEVRKRAGEGDGPVSEMRQRARELAEKRKQEASEARELEQVRAAQRARRQSEAGRPAPSSDEPIQRRPEH
ncbi:MAG: DUF3566 domain-containing protein [Nitriliruptorales bacterium]|nr:DUF3566 domain-containing protein [Nitriliruptorales bacterium]